MVPPPGPSVQSVLSKCLPGEQNRENAENRGNQENAENGESGGNGEILDLSALTPHPDPDPFSPDSLCFVHSLRFLILSREERATRPLLALVFTVDAPSGEISVKTRKIQAFALLAAGCVPAAWDRAWHTGDAQQVSEGTNACSLVTCLSSLVPSTMSRLPCPHRLPARAHTPQPPVLSGAPYQLCPACGQHSAPIGDSPDGQRQAGPEPEPSEPANMGMFWGDVPQPMERTGPARDRGPLTPPETASPRGPMDKGPSGVEAADRREPERPLVAATGTAGSTWGACQHLGILWLPLPWVVHVASRRSFC